MSDQSIPQTNEACCQIPPVQSNYQAKGKKIALGSYQEVYVIGPEDSKTAVIALFDIFGFFPQTQLGADSIAEALNARVYMPDVFFGDPCPIEVYPPKNDEDKKVIGDFFQNQAKNDRVLPGLLNLAKILRDGGAEKLYIYGLCWGGKVTTLAGCETYNDNGQSRPFFDAVAALHPANLSAADGEKLVVPIAIYASKDEPLEEFKKLVENLGQRPFASKNAYRVYPTMHHGWGGARAKLEDPDNKEQFADVYGRLVTFFKNASAD